MEATAALKRWLAVAVTAGVFAVIVVASARRAPEADKGGKTKPAEGWPLFGGAPDRNFVNTWDRNILTEWDLENGTNVVWSAEPGSKAYGGPVVAAGKVFIGTNNERPRDPKIKGDKGVLMCFDAKSGKFLWQAIHDKLAAGRVNDWPLEGICSTPVVDGDRLYYVSNRAEVICSNVNGDNGKEKIIWKLDMIGKLGVFPHNLAVCSPLIAGDILYVVTANGVDEEHINIPAPEAPSFIALNKRTGQVLWKNNFPSRALAEARKAGQVVNIKELVDAGKLLMHGQWSNPVYAEAGGRPQIIFPGGDGWLYGFDPKSGALIWKFDCNPKDAIYKLGGRGTRSDFIGTPVVYRDKVYIGVGQDPEHDEGVGHLWCIDITKKPKNADKDLSPVKNNFDPKAPQNKDSGLVWHYGGPVKRGDKVNREYYFGRTLSTCAVHDGLCYAADLDGYIYCFDAETGEKYWDHNMRSAVWCSPYWVDGKVYMANDDGAIHVFAHGKKKKLLTTIDCGAMVRATPVVANGTLFLMTESPTKLYAIRKK